MIDEILVGLFGQMVFGRLSASRRAQFIARIFFGLLGSVLSAIGAYHFAQDPKFGVNLPFRTSIIAMFVFFGCFWLLNVALGRKWKWPWLCFILSFVSVFVTRIAFGP